MPNISEGIKCANLKLQLRTYVAVALLIEIVWLFITLFAKISL